MPRRIVIVSAVLAVVSIIFVVIAARMCTEDRRNRTERRMGPDGSCTATAYESRVATACEAGVALGVAGAALSVAGFFAARYCARPCHLSAIQSGGREDQEGHGDVSQISGGAETKLERFVRARFEEATGYKFPSVTGKLRVLKWLKSRRGHPLEYDGYSSELGVAFELQGPFHYRYCAFADSKRRAITPGIDPWDPDSFIGAEVPWSLVNKIKSWIEVNSYHKFLQTVENDALKVSLSAENGIKLICIPYSTATLQTKTSWLRLYIKSRLSDIQAGERPQGYLPAEAPPAIDYRNYRLTQVPLRPAEYKKSKGDLYEVPGSMLKYNKKTLQYHLPSLFEVKPPSVMPSKWRAMRGVDGLYYDPVTFLVYNRDTEKYFKPSSETGASIPVYTGPSPCRWVIEAFGDADYPPEGSAAP